MSISMDIDSEIMRCRDRLHTLENATTILQGEMYAVSKMPEQVTDLRVAMGSLKARISVIGTITLVAWPTITAIVLHYMGVRAP